MIPWRLDGSQKMRRILFRFFCGLSFCSFASIALAAGEAEWNECVSGDNDIRIATCTKILQDHPSGPGEHALAYFARGDAYLAKEEYDKAISDLDEATKLGLIRAGIYSRRGSARSAKGQRDLAIADFNEAIRLDSRFAPAYRARGQSHQARGDNDQAIADYSEAIRLGEVNAGTFFARGLAYISKGDADHAIADFSESIRLDGKSNAVYGSRGIAHIANRDYHKAIADFSEAINRNNSFGPSYGLRAVAYVFSGNYNAAIADYSKAIELNPNHPDNYANRGRAYLHIGLSIKASDDLRKAALLNPKDVYAVLWLDRANRKADSPSELSAQRSAFTWNEWPVPLLDFFLGRITQAELYAAAENEAPKLRRQQLCEANFYSGMKRLITGNKEEAEGFFRSAADRCPKNVVEWLEANAELKTNPAGR